MKIKASNQLGFTIKLQTIVLDCEDSELLSNFYAKLLGWSKLKLKDDWEILCDPTGNIDFAFESEPLYHKPVWPEKPNHPQKMIHLDFLVDNLEKATEHALHCGAQLSPDQFYDDVRVFFDPAGHPFCFFTGYKPE